jgi:hypothetical protein
MGIPAGVWMLAAATGREDELPITTRTVALYFKK